VLLAFAPAFVQAFVCLFDHKSSFFYQESTAGMNADQFREAAHAAIEESTHGS